MANKITNKMRYEALIDLVKANGISVSSGDEVENTEGMVAFLESRIEGLVKKASKTNEKKNSANEEIRTAIYDVLATEGKPLKISEILLREPIASIKGEEGLPLSSQKVSYEANAMVKAGELVKTTDKKVSYFSVA